MATSPLQALQKGLHPEWSDDRLNAMYDARVQQNRDAEDAYQGHVLNNTSDPEFANAIQATNAQTGNRAREDMATGPAGYNRNWVPLIETPDALAQATGKQVRMAPQGIGAATPALTGLQAAVPQGYADFMRAMRKKYGDAFTGV